MRSGFGCCCHWIVLRLRAERWPSPSWLEQQVRGHPEMARHGGRGGTLRICVCVRRGMMLLHGLLWLRYVLLLLVERGVGVSEMQRRAISHGGGWVAGRDARA